MTRTIPPKDKPKVLAHLDVLNLWLEAVGFPRVTLRNVVNIAGDYGLDGATRDRIAALLAASREYALDLPASATPTRAERDLARAFSFFDIEVKR